MAKRIKMLQWNCHHFEACRAFSNAKFSE